MILRSPTEDENGRKPGIAVILNAVKDLLYVFDQDQGEKRDLAQSAQRFLISNSSLRVLRASAVNIRTFLIGAPEIAQYKVRAWVISATGGSASLTSRPGLSYAFV